jgi:hypothetical protein
MAVLKDCIGTPGFEAAKVSGIPMRSALLGWDQAAAATGSITRAGSFLVRPASFNSCTTNASGHRFPVSRARANSGQKEITT